MADAGSKPPAKASKPEKRLPPAELFAKYDEDSNGAIDAFEVFKLFNECNYTLDDEMVIELMAEFGDGMMEEELDFEQFSAMLRALDTRILFKQYDLNGSGAIDAFELASMLEACGHDSSPDFVAGLIERHSKNGESGSELDVEGFGEALAELDAKGGEKLAFAQQNISSFETTEEGNPKVGCASSEESNRTQMTGIVTAASERRPGVAEGKADDNGVAESKSGGSLIGRDVAPAVEETHQSDEVTSLLTNLAEKEAMLADKDAEIVRLKEDDVGVAESKSGWSLIGRCAAPAIEETHQSDEVTSLLAKLVEKEAMLADKYAEIVRLKADDVGVAERKSGWSLIGRGVAPAIEETHQSDEVASLLAKLVEKEAMLVEKDLKLSEKDAEIVRLKALVSRLVSYIK